MIYDRHGFDVSQLATDEAKALIAETARILTQAIDDGLPHEVPETVRYALENNAFVFSGFKTFHSMREIGLSMVTDKGDIKPFNQFLNDVQTINKKYNRNYLYAEYNHAVGTSLMAAKWHDIEQDGDRYDLQYRTANDSHVREEHALLNDTTLPPSDPFWDKYYPPNGWNCRCTVVQVRKGKYPTSDPELAMKRGDNCTASVKQQMFRYNPGKTMELFPPKHPYYKTPAEAKKAVEQMAAEQQREYIAQRRREIRQYMAEHLDEPLVNQEFHRTATMSGGSVKEFLNQPHKFLVQKNELLLDIKRVFKGARYLGVNPAYVKKGLKHSHVFEIELCGERSWMLVREYQDGRCFVYSCSDSPKVATGLIKEKDPE